MERFDVVVVGAGLIGSTIAWKLAQRGRRVALFDRGEPGGEATWASNGLLIPQAGGMRADLLALYLAGLAGYDRFVAEVREASRRSFDYRRCGHVLLALDESRAEAFQSSLTEQAEAGLRAEWLGADDVRRLEPAANPAALGGLYFAEHALLDNRAFGKAIARAAAAAGAVVRPYEPVLSLALGAGRVDGVETIQGKVAAEVVVNAAGAWASVLAPRDERPRVGPSKGEMIALAAPVQPFERIISIPGGSVSPRGDGRVYVGATSQVGVFSKDVAASAVARLLATATTAVPTLSQARFSEAWAGLRPLSADGFPLIGADDLAGLFWASGHGGMGIVSAPSTAEILVDLVEGRVPALPFEGFSPRRRTLLVGPSASVNATC